MTIRYLVYILFFACVLFEKRGCPSYAQETRPGIKARIYPDSLDHEIIRNQEAKNLQKLVKNYLAKVDQTNSERVKAAYLKKALIIEQKLKHPKEILSLHQRLASSYLLLQDRDNALIEQFELLKLFQKAKDSLRIAQTHSAIASLQDDRNDFKSAYHHYYLALQFARALRSERGQSAILNNIAGLYLKDDSISKAFESVYQAMELNRKSGNTYWLSINYMMLADIYAKTNRHDSTRYYLEQTELALGRSGNIDDSIALARKWGIYYYHTGKPQQAISRFNNGIILSRRIGSLQSEATFVHWLSEVYGSIGDPERAMAYLETHHTLLDSLRKTQDSERLEGLEVLYNMQQMQDHLRTALLQGEVAKKEIRYKRTQLSAILVVTLLLLILLIYGFIQYRRKLQTNQVLMRLQLVPGENKTKYAQSNLSDETRQKILDQLSLFMQQEQVFRDQDLTISQVADQLSVSRTYLSQVINETYGQNFTNYINEYRIELAKKYLANREYDKYAISGIAEMVGFRSLSSFNTCFKKITGLTPSYYRNNS